MKKLKYLMMAAVCVLFAACMGDSYAEPADTGSVLTATTNWLRRMSSLLLN